MLLFQSLVTCRSPFVNLCCWEALVWQCTGSGPRSTAHSSFQVMCTLEGWWVTGLCTWVSASHVEGCGWIWGSWLQFLPNWLLLTCLEWTRFCLSSHLLAFQIILIIKQCSKLYETFLKVPLKSQVCLKMFPLKYYLWHSADKIGEMLVNSLIFWWSPSIIQFGHYARSVK